MRCCLSTLGSPEYMRHVAHATSVTPEFPYSYRRYFTIYSEALIELGGDVLEARDGVNSAMNLEAMIERVWTCT